MKSDKEVFDARVAMTHLALIRGVDKPIDCYAGASAALLWAGGMTIERAFGDPPMPEGPYEQFLYAMMKLLDEHSTDDQTAP